MKVVKVKLLGVAFFLAVVNGFSQTKEWESNMNLKYEYTINNKLVNFIEVKKDTICYRWIEYDKTMERFIVNGNSQKQILELMDKYSFLKFKKGKLDKKASNGIFVYKKQESIKTLYVPLSKSGTQEDLFMKEFLELVFKRVSEQELMVQPN